MISYALLITISIGFFITLFTIPIWIKRAKQVGLIGKDMNKFENKTAVEAGGISVLLGFTLAILFYVAVNTFYFNRYDNVIQIFSLLCSILIVGFIGFADDILGWKIGLTRNVRLLFLIFAAIPLMVINAGISTISIPFFGIVEFGLFYPLILIPLGIVGTTATFNFLAGFNSLEAGQGIIFLSALSIVSYFTGNAWLSVILLCMVAALIAFLIFNMYPAKVFPGDILTYPIGALIAISAILGNFEKIALFFFIPYIIEVGFKLRGKLKKESFGKPLKDGTLELKYNKLYGLTHISIYFLKKIGVKPTEKSVVYAIWTFQILVILVGFIIFRNGIFLI